MYYCGLYYALFTLTITDEKIVMSLCPAMLDNPGAGQSITIIMSADYRSPRKLFDFSSLGEIMMRYYRS